MLTLHGNDVSTSFVLHLGMNATLRCPCVVLQTCSLADSFVPGLSDKVVTCCLSHNVGKTVHSTQATRILVHARDETPRQVETVLWLYLKLELYLVLQNIHPKTLMKLEQCCQVLKGLSWRVGRVLLCLEPGEQTRKMRPRSRCGTVLTSTL